MNLPIRVTFLGIQDRLDSVVVGDVLTEDARRIVACVNACAKVETEDLERLMGLGGLIQLIVYAEDMRSCLADALILLMPTNCATPEGWADRKRLAEELPGRIRELIEGAR